MFTTPTPLNRECFATSSMNSRTPIGHGRITKSILSPNPPPPIAPPKGARITSEEEPVLRPRALRICASRVSGREGGRGFGGRTAERAELGGGGGVAAGGAQPELVPPIRLRRRARLAAVAARHPRAAPRRRHRRRSIDAERWSPATDRPRP